MNRLLQRIHWWWTWRGNIAPSGVGGYPGPKTTAEWDAHAAWINSREDSNVLRTQTSQATCVVAFRDNRDMNRNLNERQFVTVAHHDYHSDSIKRKRFEYYEDADKYGATLTLAAGHVPNSEKLAKAIGGRDDYQRSYRDGSNVMGMSYGQGKYKE